MEKVIKCVYIFHHLSTNHTQDLSIWINTVLSKSPWALLSWATLCRCRINCSTSVIKWRCLHKDHWKQKEGKVGKPLGRCTRISSHHQETWKSAAMPVIFLCSCSPCSSYDVLALALLPLNWSCKCRLNI